MRGAEGSTIAGRYAIEARLGAGGMGVVYRARDERLARDVALKLLPPFHDGAEEARARLLREARAGAALAHPGIVHVYDVGETDDGGAYVVMELVRGASVARLAEEGRLTVADRVRVVREVAAALAFAHERGIVHRDVKPENVMVREDGRAVVLDFGLAKRLPTGAPDEGASAGTFVSLPGTVLGTPGYVAPEQLAGEPVDARADQFSLAVMAFELLTGALPWPATSAMALLVAALTTAPRRASEIASGAPPELDDVLARALSRDPACRYASVEELGDALAAVPFDAAGSAETERSPARGAASDRPTAPSARSTERPTAAAAASTPRADASGDAPPPTARSGDVALPASAGRAGRWRHVAAGGVLAVVVGVGAVAARAVLTPPAPLAPPASVLACPILAVEGEAELPGWLGAIAADVACRRAANLVGARPERTLVPAELLGLEPRPSESFPRDPFEGATARDRTLAEARSRADAWLDGRVTASHAAFAVRVVLRDRRGAEVARGEGFAQALVAAAQAAVESLPPSALPRAERIDADRAAWLGTDRPDVAQALEDVEAQLFSPVGAAACDRLERAGALPAVGVRRCTLARLRRIPPAPPPSIDRSSVSAFAASVVARVEARERDPIDVADELDRAAAADGSATARARASTAVARVALGRAPDRARQAALAGVLGAPRSFAAWNALSFAVLGAPGEGVTLRALAAHNPSYSENFSILARYDGADEAARARYLRVGYRASGRFATYAIQLGAAMIDAGERESVRTLAAEVVGDADPSAGAREVLLTRVEAAEGRFEEALARAAAFVERRPDFGWTVNGDVHEAGLGFELAWALGRERAYAEAFLHRYLDGDPPGLLPDNLVVLAEVAVAASLSGAVVARGAVERLRRLRASGYFGGESFASVDVLVSGVEAFAAGRFDEAARAWLPLARDDGGLVLARRAALVVADAFDRAGLHAEAALVDAPALARRGGLRGASAAMVRAAVRDRALGDLGSAKQRAGAVVAAWSAASGDVPWLAAMRAIAAGEPPPTRARSPARR